MVLMRAKMISVGLLGTAIVLPLASAKAEQVGHASWYALHSRTASGEMMNPSTLTAAHRSLPFGTRVVVENLNNGQTVVVRINDRGPFVGGRIIDLSRAAAASIGMIGSGTAKVRVTTTGSGSLQALGASQPKIIKTAAVETNPVAEPERSAKMSAALKGVTSKRISSSKRSISATKGTTIKTASRKSATRSALAYKSAKSVRTASLAKKRYGTSRSTRERIVPVSKSARSSAKSRTAHALGASKTGRAVSKRSERKSVTIASRQNLYPVLGGKTGFMKGKSYRPS
jgi:peptidoglycan lytic transglycosylase